MTSPASGMESQASGVRPQAVRRTIGDMTGGDGPQAEATPDPFVAHRGLLFTVAYEMLGSAADAEDAVQETWLRWANVDQTQIHDPRAYLVRIERLDHDAQGARDPRSGRTGGVRPP